MKLMLTVVAMLCACAASTTALAQTTKSTQPAEHDVRSFQLTPAAPPKPALKYQLLYSDLADRLPGDAAMLYMDAVLLMGPDAKAKAERAHDAFVAKDAKTFESLADELELPSVFTQLDLAARRERCDWDPPFRETGVYTLLPHLEPLFRGTGRLIQVRAMRQIGQGKTDDAVKTLRMGYELADKVGRESMLISGLVSLRITGFMNEALVELMNRPDAPNLYWALVGYPSRNQVFRNGLDGERLWVVPSVPYLKRVRDGEQLTAEQWRAALDYVWGVADIAADQSGQRKHPDPVKDAKPETLKQARQAYALAHGMPADDVAKLDPVIVLGEFYFRQYEIAFDEMYKLRHLPYPVQLSHGKRLSAFVEQYCRDLPATPFQVYAEAGNVVMSFARADRQLAALTAVEAIRSYAAANNGALPKRLEDVTDTPVPQNPLTGASFEYRVEGNTATLSDTRGESKLTYTITLRG